MSGNKDKIILRGLAKIASEIPLNSISYINPRTDEKSPGYMCMGCDADIHGKSESLKAQIKHEKYCPAIKIRKLVEQKDTKKCLDYLRDLVYETYWDYEGGGECSCPHCHKFMNSETGDAMGIHHNWCPMKNAIGLLKKIGEKVDLRNVER